MLEHSKELLDVIQDWNKKYEQAQKRVNECNDAIQDILHYIEFTPRLNVVEGYRLYDELRVLRVERRDCYEFIEQYNKIKHQLTTLGNTLTTVTEKLTDVTLDQSCRYYNVRVYEDEMGKRIYGG